MTEFLLLNAEFPRSIRFSATRVEGAVAALARYGGRSDGTRVERLSGRLRASLDYAQVDEALSEGPHAYLIAQDRHIRVAVGRDYADVPPPRGVYEGVTAVRSELGVAVRVGPAPSPLSSDVVPFTPWM